MYRGDWMEALARNYQDERLKESERARLLAQARLAHPVSGVQARVLSNSGDALISLGRWLKQRAEPGLQATLMLHSVGIDRATCDQ